MNLECQNCKCAILEGVYCNSCASFMAQPVAEEPKSAVKQVVEKVTKTVKKKK